MQRGRGADQGGDADLNEAGTRCRGEKQCATNQGRFAVAQLPDRCLAQLHWLLCCNIHLLFQVVLRHCSSEKLIGMRAINKLYAAAAMPAETT
jgi:hypothetical protein